MGIQELERPSETVSELSYKELRKINTERKKDYEAFKVKHDKRMATLEKKEQKLNKEYERLKNLVFGVTVKMTVK